MTLPVKTLDPTPNDPLAGTLLGERFRILSRVGSGGMGVAYRAWDLHRSLPVVVKLPKESFLDNPRFVERFTREIRLLQGLSHPHIVPIVGIGNHGRAPFVAMRFLPGGSLTHRRLRDAHGVPLPNPESMLHHWLPAVASGLDYVHAEGVVHRDVKPGNVFFDAGWTAFLGDFGVAKVVAESEAFDVEHTLTATGMGIGTQGYMAPEQFTPKARLDGRVDQYALAVMVFELVCGQRPFTGEKANLIVEVLTTPAPSLSSRMGSLPATLVEAVQRALSKRPGDRYSSCTEFAEAALRDVAHPAGEDDVVRLVCPQCSRVLKLPSHFAGRKGTCGKCRGRISVSEDLGALWLLSEVEELSAAWAGPGRTVAAPPEEEPLEEFPSVTLHTPRHGRRRHGRRHGATIPRSLAGIAIAVVALCGMALVLMRGTAWQPSAAATRRDRGVAAPGSDVVRNDQVPAVGMSGREGGAVPADESPLEERQGDVVNAYGMRFRRIPRGEFVMGDAPGGPNPSRQEVELSTDFYLGAIEVTNADWMRVMRVGRGKLPGRWKDDALPVTNVTQTDAIAFCDALSAREEEQRAGRRYRLPTEAEWERACRAGTTTRFSFVGAENDLLTRHAWYAGNSGGRPHPAGRKQPNPWGLYDMHGNAWEWCSDMYRTYASSKVVDPRVEGFGDVVRRGGSFRSPPEDCRSAKRGTFSPTMADAETGLRLVMEVLQKPVPAAPVAGPKGVPFRDRRYWFSPTRASFDEAETVARGMAGALVVIDDAEENAFVAQRMSGPTWLGLQKRGSGWVRLDDGAAATFFAWAGGQPSNHAAETAAATHERGAWHDHFPADALHFCVEFADDEAPAEGGRPSSPGTTIASRSRPSVIENGLGMRFQLLPAGTFMMGSKDGGDDEKPVHRVRITKPFYLGVHEVTGDQWLAVMGSLPSRWRGKGRPVEQVSWEAAVDFCRALGRHDAERGSGRIYRLPTEAEWEYACRAGTTTSYASGDKPESLSAFAWFRGNAAEQTHPVGEREPNAWGLHDMHGNVWEWCADRYGRYPDASRTVLDPTGPEEGGGRVLRGGSWCDDAPLCRSAVRNVNGLGPRIGNVGVRVVLDHEEADGR